MVGVKSSLFSGGGPNEIFVFVARWSDRSRVRMLLLKVLSILSVKVRSSNVAECSVSLVGRDINCTKPLLCALSIRSWQLTSLSYLIRSWLKSPTIYFAYLPFIY